MENFWCQKLNVYPQPFNKIAIKIEKDFGTRKNLIYYPDGKKGETYAKRVKEFNEKMQTGYDVKTDDRKRIEKLQISYQVKMLEEDLLLWEDNCMEKKCDCDWDSLVKCEICPRQIYTSTIIDKEWLKWRNRKFKAILTAAAIIVKSARYFVFFEIVIPREVT